MNTHLYTSHINQTEIFISHFVVATIMDPLTLEELIETGKTFGAIAAIGGAFLATTAIGIASFAEIKRRYELVKHYKDSSYEGRLKVKPNLFNIRKIISNDPEYKNKYWNRSSGREA